MNAAPMTPDRYAERCPDRPAIVMGAGERVTYRQLTQRSRVCARALRERGLAVGDHIAILAENTLAFLEIAWAAQRSGLYYTPVNRHLRTGEVQYILDDCGASALVSTAAMAEVVAELDLRRMTVQICVDGELDGFETYDDVLAGTDTAPLPDECEGREMLYSGGTTGRPKGVRKPLPATAFGDPECAPVQIARGLYAAGARDDAVYLCPAPLYHAAPLVFAMSWQRLGATVVVMERFDPDKCLQLIERHRVTHVQMVPTMFVRMLRLPRAQRRRYDTSSLVDVVHSAAPCPVPVKRQMLEWLGPIVNEYYSGTEDVGSTYISAPEWLAHPGSVGRPAQQCHIVGDDGQSLPAGQTGLVYFEGGRAFEYHNDPERAAAVVGPHGWRTLGDIGYLDRDGYLYLTDRQSHMIVSGGVNIYPQEAENVLAAHPAVLDAAVIGVPDEDMGEAVRAVVQPLDPAGAGPALADELIAACRGELASYKCPRVVEFTAELPRDPNGKLYKRLLRQRYWPGHDDRVI